MKRRRGVFYLISALLITVVLLGIIFSRANNDERPDSVKTRILALSNFLSDIDSDVPRATYISGFRSFIALEEYMTEKGEFLPNATPYFIEAFFNGTIDSVPYDVLTNSTFSEYLQRVNVEAVKRGIELNISPSGLTMRQRTPWSVAITFKLTINVSDTRGLADWNYDENFTTEIPIYDLRDPVYSVFTEGKLPNVIRVSPYNNSQFVSGNDTTVLDNEVEEMYYREDPHAPSFLQRMQGNLTGSSKYGIASLVNLDDLNAQGLTIHTDHSIIDYIYFSNSTTTNYCPTFGTPLPSWFKIDATHYNDAEHDYEIPELNATTC